MCRPQMRSAYWECFMRFKNGDVLITTETSAMLEELLFVERVEINHRDYVVRPLKNIRDGEPWRSGTDEIERHYRLLTEAELKLLHILIV